MHVGCINEIKGKNLIFGCLKYMNHVFKYAILLRISLKRQHNDRRIGLLRHARINTFKPSLSHL